MPDSVHTTPHEDAAGASSDVSSATESFSFQADVNQVLDIVIHSLYSHPEIFLRELISNAADAIDRLRFRSLTEHDLLGDERELEIRLYPEREAKAITIMDTGIGMTRAELIENLGTIARSGSQRFLETLREKGQAAEGLDLIGQFGVGFYSSFLVARKVEVTSLAVGENLAYHWCSEASGTFTVEPAPNKITRGTEVKLFLKPDHTSFLDEQSLRSLVRRYSDFVSHPIKLEVEREEGEGKCQQKVKKLETINTASALWRRPKKEISDAQYDDFYTHLTRDWEKPLARTHFHVEGAQAFTGLLFIPRRAPFDLYDRARRRGVCLYVKRVFIMDDCEQLLPEWLRFVRGIVDSDDLPLNVSRELLQEDRVVRAIRKQIVKRTLELLEEIAGGRPADYVAFWKTFGAVLKEGLHYEPEHKDRLAKLVRYASSKQELTSLTDYVGRMPEGQDALYYAIGLDRKAVEGSPHIEGLVKKGFEVLFMTDPIDEWAVHALGEFEGKKLVSAMQSGLDLEKSEPEAGREQREKRGAVLRDLIDRFRAVLQESVSEVRLSARLTDSPCCLVVPEGGLHAHTERWLRATTQGLPPMQRILELNPDHPVIERLRVLNEAKSAEKEVAEWIELLYDQALLAEGSPIVNPQLFARRLTGLMNRALAGPPVGGRGLSEGPSEGPGEA
ncbi:MAG: molecular chaperone HtpG [Planctomycetota bacterium]